MPIYMISVACAAALSGIIMSVIFYRLKIFNYRTAASITLASLITALIMPGIFSVISSYKNSAIDPSAALTTTIISLLVYLIIAFILSIVISFILPKIKIGRRMTASLQNTSLEVAMPEVTSEVQLEAAPTESAVSDTLQSALPLTEPVSSEILTSAEAAVSAEPEAEEASSITSEDKIISSVENIMEGDLNMWGSTKSNSTGAAGDNYIEEIFLNFVGRNEDDLTAVANNVENEGLGKNCDEKSVDSNENIDKMGIENNIQDSGSLTIEECIDEAYRLREQGDPEGSILYYMYALDKKPQKELTFWIILDICVMYKSLGQQDLALDILDSYYDIYGDEMDSSIKKEIARNLTDIRA